MKKIEAAREQARKRQQVEERNEQARRQKLEAEELKRFLKESLRSKQDTLTDWLTKLRYRGASLG